MRGLTSYLRPNHNQRESKTMNPAAPAILLKVRWLDDTESIKFERVKLLAVRVLASEFTIAHGFFDDTTQSLEQHTVCSVI